ncbi:MAG TPA: radical SAM protein, partial [Vicinamibacteria bacterium]|nr:radical SAM protein [Vicinamibacteria bacterium]
MSRLLHERHRGYRQAEVPLQEIKQAGSFRIALCYPNLYFVGMSNLGFHSVYQMLNTHPDVLCERAFLPDDVDREDLERTGQPLTTVESGSELRAFHALAFSVSFENDYLYVLRMLRLAGIPLRAKDRGPHDPIVILGGAAVFLNPEPLAPFADLIAVGEGEALVPRMIEALAGASDARKGIETLAEKDGFYVPGRHEVRYHADGTVAAYDGPGRAIRQRGWPGKMALPQSVILTPHTEMSMKFMVEISRGCPCMCRFCWAGYNYLPVRGFSRADIIARAREVRPHANKIGLVSTAVCDHPEIEAIVDDLAGLKYEVSVASLRLDDLTPEFVFKLADTGVHGLTLAPECGTDRMRNILNKQFTNADILDRATWIFENGIQNLKLYYMVGLPWERHEDVEGIVTLTEQIRDRMIQVGRSRGRVGRI